MVFVIHNRFSDEEISNISLQLNLKYTFRKLLKNYLIELKVKSNIIYTYIYMKHKLLHEGDIFISFLLY